MVLSYFNYIYIYIYIYNFSMLYDNSNTILAFSDDLVTLSYYKNLVNIFFYFSCVIILILNFLYYNNIYNWIDSNYNKYIYLVMALITGSIVVCVSIKLYMFNTSIPIILQNSYNEFNNFAMVMSYVPIIHSDICTNHMLWYLLFIFFILMFLILLYQNYEKFVTTPESLLQYFSSIFCIFIASVVCNFWVIFAMFEASFLYFFNLALPNIVLFRNVNILEEDKSRTYVEHIMWNYFFIEVNHTLPPNCFEMYIISMGFFLCGTGYLYAICGTLNFWVIYTYPFSIFQTFWINFFFLIGFSLSGCSINCFNEFQELHNKISCESSMFLSSFLYSISLFFFGCITNLTNVSFWNMCCSLYILYFIINLAIQISNETDMKNIVVSIIHYENIYLALFFLLIPWEGFGYLIIYYLITPIFSILLFYLLNAIENSSCIKLNPYILLMLIFYILFFVSFKVINIYYAFWVLSDIYNFIFILLNIWHIIIVSTSFVFYWLERLYDIDGWRNDLSNLKDISLKLNNDPSYNWYYNIYILLIAFIALYMYFYIMDFINNNINKRNENN